MRRQHQLPTVRTHLPALPAHDLHAINTSFPPRASAGTARSRLTVHVHALRLIGTRGSTILAIERDSGLEKGSITVHQDPPPGVDPAHGGWDCLVLITGGFEAVERACHLCLYGAEYGLHPWLSPWSGEPFGSAMHLSAPMPMPPPQLPAVRPWVWDTHFGWVCYAPQAPSDPLAYSQGEGAAPNEIAH